MNASQNSPGPDGREQAMQGSSRRSETATLADPAPPAPITSTGLKPGLDDRGFNQPEQTVGYFFLGAFEEGDGFGFRRKHFNRVRK